MCMCVCVCVCVCIYHACCKNNFRCFFDWNSGANVMRFTSVNPSLTEGGTKYFLYMLYAIRGICLIPTHAHTHTHTHTHTHKNPIKLFLWVNTICQTHTHTHTYTHTCMRTFQLFTHYVQMFRYGHRGLEPVTAHRYVCMSTCVCVYVCVCMCGVCVFVFNRKPQVHSTERADTHIYTHIQIKHITNSHIRTWRERIHTHTYHT